MNAYPTGSAGPETWGHVVQLALPPAPAAWGQMVRSDPAKILQVARSRDDSAEAFDITLSSPQRVLPVADVPPAAVHPLEELVGIIKWGQQQADSSGTRTTGEGFECEVDWVAGVVVTVNGSNVEVWARRDNWGASPPAPTVDAYINPGVRDVQALLGPRGARSTQPHRTLWHPTDLGVGNINVQNPPAFARNVQVYTPALPASILRIAALGLDVFTTIGSITFPTGTISPLFELPNGTRFLAIANMGAMPVPFTCVYGLAL